MVSPVAMASQYNAWLVALSVVIALIASYAALDLAGRVAASQGRSRFAWLAGGAFAMGTGIWAMHYIGMLAFQLSVPVLYNLPIVLSSLLAAVLASAVALYVVSLRELGSARVVSGGIAMGFGIAGMHYLGMAAMRLPAESQYDPRLVVLSVSIAIAVSFVALGLAIRRRDDVGPGSVWRKLGNAALMGAAIPGMHYVGMAAVRFHATEATPRSAHAINVSSLGIGVIAIATFLILGLAILTSVVDRWLSAKSTALETTEGALETSKGDLQDQRQFLRDVIDANPHPVFAKDWDGRFTLANKAVAEIYGATPEDLVGKRDSDFHSNPEEVARVLHEDRQVMESGRPSFVSAEPITDAPTGKTRWFQTIKVPLLSVNGTARQVLGIATDITDRKLLEEQLRQSQKMEAVGRLAGGIAHDFNNLLTAIIGHVELLLEDADPTDPAREDLTEINHAASRAAGLTRQLLAFSRKQVLQPQVLDLNALVANTYKLLRRMIGEDVELRIVAGAALGALQADPGQLEQVLMNLAVNARDAMPRGGRLTIESANADIDEEYSRNFPPMPPGPYIMLAVSDTGNGMNAATKSHLFEPFFTTKEAGKGTGLGLATVYGIVKQSGGFIWVESEPDQGTTFRIYLPRIAAAAQEIPSSASLPSSTDGSETVLVVEDEELVRKLTCRVLEKRGYHILTASSGEQALQLASEYAGVIHLLLTDVVMPRMSGSELVKRLSPLRPATKVLYVSGYADDTVVHHGVLEAGVVLLQKPFAPELLARKVREVLSLN